MKSVFIFIFISVLAFQGLAADTTYFSGEEVMYSPDGTTPWEIKPKLLKRVVDQKTNKVFEESVILVEGEVKIADLVLRISGNSFSTVTTDYSGTGQFWGSPWKWSAWISEFESRDGLKLKVINYLTDSSLYATSEVFDANDTLIAVMKADLKIVDKITYEDHKKKLMEGASR